MDTLAEQRTAGWVIGLAALSTIAIGAWVARTGSTRWINGVDFSRIDPRDHARAAAIVGWCVAAIGATQLPVAAWLAAAPDLVEPEWLVAVAVLLPTFLLTGVMFVRLQGLYRR